MTPCRRSAEVVGGVAAEARACSAVKTPRCVAAMAQQRGCQNGVRAIGRPWQPAGSRGGCVIHRCRRG